MAWRRLCRSANCASELVYLDAGASSGISRSVFCVFPIGCCAWAWLSGAAANCSPGWPATSGVWLSVVVTNLKTSKESGFSADAADTPK